MPFWGLLFTQELVLYTIFRFLKLGTLEIASEVMFGPTISPPVVSAASEAL